MTSTEVMVGSDSPEMGTHTPGTYRLGAVLPLPDHWQPPYSGDKYRQADQSPAEELSTPHTGPVTAQPRTDSIPAHFLLDSHGYYANNQHDTSQSESRPGQVREDLSGNSVLGESQVFKGGAGPELHTRASVSFPGWEIR